MDAELWMQNALQAWENGWEVVCWFCLLKAAEAGETDGLESGTVFDG